MSTDGDILPMQLIYAGKEDRCNPNGINFPEGFHITHTPNLWSFEKISNWGLSKKRKQLNMPNDETALLIFDVKDVILASNCVYVFVPINITNHFRPLDLNVNGPAKQFLKRKFESWYADQVTKEVEKGTDVYYVTTETKLSVIKPLHASWLISFYDQMQNNHEMIIKAFQMVGITPIPETETPDEDPFKNI